jgi:cell division protein FtsB
MLARWIWLLAVIVSIYYGGWAGEYSARDLLRMEGRVEQVRTEADLLTAELESLRALAHNLQGDSASVERVARERLGMIRSGEMLYRFVEVEGARCTDDCDP